MHSRIRRGRAWFSALALILALPLVAQTQPVPRPDQAVSEVPQNGLQPRFVAEPGTQPNTTELTGTALTLAETLKYFRERGFDLAIANANIEAADADVVSASALTNPSISVARGSSSTYDPAQCAGCSSTSVGAGIADQGAFSDLVTGKRRLRVAVARSARAAARSSRADVERTLEFTVKQQLLQAELAKRSLQYAVESQRLAIETLTIVDKRYKAGAVSEADVARADVLKLEADQFADLASQALASAKAGLTYLLGFGDGSQAIDVSDDLLHVEPLAQLADGNEEAMLRAALQRRPDLLQVTSQIARAQSSVDLARRLNVPDLLPSFNYSAEGRGQNAIQPPTITFGVTATIPLFNRHRGDIARAMADLRTQVLIRRKVRAQIGSDVATAVAAFHGSVSRVTRMDAHLLSRAARARDLVKLQYEKGAVSLFEYLDAQRTWLATRTEHLQTINDYWNAVFQLEAATAMELYP